MTNIHLKYLKNANKIIIKIGSSLLIDEKIKTLKQSWLNTLSSDINYLIKLGKQIIIVSSGAINLGRNKVGFTKKKLKLEQSQALAAIGQITLIHAYENAFKPFNIQIAQILLSLEDSENRKRYINATNNINTLMHLGFIPIINENDTIATTDICFGDNDRLAARIALMINADMLLLLTDIDGLYTSNPYKNNNAKHIAVIKTISNSILKTASTSKSTYSKGGMITKLLAAKIVTSSGCPMIIGDGRNKNPIISILNGAKFSIFLSQKNFNSSKKKWLNTTLEPKGNLIIDKGALIALLNGKSLLSAGIIAIKGKFNNGDILEIFDLNNNIIAHGLTNYDSGDIGRIIGKKSYEIYKILGYIKHKNIIHRNNLVLTNKNK